MDISDATEGRLMVKLMVDDSSLSIEDAEKLRDDLVAMALQRFPDLQGDAVVQELSAGTRNWRRVGDKVVLGA